MSKEQVSEYDQDVSLPKLDENPFEDQDHTIEARAAKKIDNSQETINVRGSDQPMEEGKTIDPPGNTRADNPSKAITDIPPQDYNQEGIKSLAASSEKKNSQASFSMNWVPWITKFVHLDDKVAVSALLPLLFN